MIKWLSMILFAVCCSFSAQAVMVQRVDDALSYRNVAKSRASNPAIQNNRAEKQNKYVDLRSTVSATVVLNKGDTLKIDIAEDRHCTLSINYDHSIFSLSDRGNTNGVRTLIFELRSDKCTNIFIDVKNKDNNSTIQNKAVFVKCN